MKIISYDPNEVKNIPKFFNEKLEEFKDEKYVMFIFDDILKNAIDINAVVFKYEELMKKFNLPYSFFPYYIHFNRILPESIKFPVPRAHIFLKDQFKFDCVNQISYGLLIVDTEKLNSINFKFNESYETSFYISDLIFSCFSNNLWISNSYFVDVFESYKLFNDGIKNGFNVAPVIFDKERTLFNKDVPAVQEQVSKFIEALKKYCENL